MSPTSTSPDLDALLDWLYGLQRLGIKVGLKHTDLLLGVCGDPHYHFPTVHIAGTNGKGSTSAMTASILQAAGLKVGLYTSPHLIRFNERIRINNIPISDLEILSFLQKYRYNIEQIESTFFETTTAMAFHYFAKNKVDVAVIETGLGGRLDSTNVLSPSVTAITPIALDHREILGRNIVEITKEKAGIIKKNTPVIIAPQSQEVMTELRKTAQSQGAPVIIVNKILPQDIVLHENGLQFRYQLKRYNSSLIGEHQALNGAMAIEISKQIDKRISNVVIEAGLKKVCWPGRLQRMVKDKPIYYDVAHNAQGLHFVKQTMRKIYPEKPAAIFVMKGDKELDLVSEAIRECFDPLIISGAPNRGLLSGKMLANNLIYHGLDTPFIMEENFLQAIEKLKTIVRENKKPGLILGSHYIAKDVFDIFNFSFTYG